MITGQWKGTVPDRKVATEDEGEGWQQIHCSTLH